MLCDWNNLQKIWALLSQYPVTVTCNFYNTTYIATCSAEIIHLCISVLLGLEGTNRNVNWTSSPSFMFFFPKNILSSNQGSKLLQAKWIIFSMNLCLLSIYPNINIYRKFENLTSCFNWQTSIFSFYRKKLSGVKCNLFCIQFAKCSMHS